MLSIEEKDKLMNVLDQKFNNPRDVVVHEDGSVFCSVDTMPGTNTRGRVFAGEVDELLELETTH